MGGLELALLQSIGKSMIYLTLAYINQVLDNYLVSKFGRDGGRAVLNNLIDQPGISALSYQNKVVITLINLELNTDGAYCVDDVDDTSAHCYNLEILISANFDDYTESLKYLAACIEFFQDNRFLTRCHSSLLPNDISALKVEVDAGVFGRAHTAWTAPDARHSPSIIYKLRPVALLGNNRMLNDHVGTARMEIFH